MGISGGRGAVARCVALAAAAALVVGAAGALAGCSSPGTGSHGESSKSEALPTSSPTAFVDAVLSRIHAAGSAHISLVTPQKHSLTAALAGEGQVKDEIDWIQGATPEDVSFSEIATTDEGDLHSVVTGRALYMSDDGTSWNAIDPDRRVFDMRGYEAAVRGLNPWSMVGWMRGAVTSVKKSSAHSTAGATEYALRVDASKVASDYGDIADEMTSDLGKTGTAHLTVNAKGLPVELTDVLGTTYAFSKWGAVAKISPPSGDVEPETDPAAPGYSTPPGDGAKLKLPTASSFAKWLVTNEKKQGSVHFHMVPSTATFAGELDAATKWKDGVTQLNWWSCDRDAVSDNGFATCYDAGDDGSTLYQVKYVNGAPAKATKYDQSDAAAKAVSADFIATMTSMSDASQLIEPLGPCITSLKDEGVEPFDQWLTGRHVRLMVEPESCDGSFLGRSTSEYSPTMPVNLWLDDDGVPLRASYTFAAYNFVVDFDGWGKPVEIVPSRAQM